MREIRTGVALQAAAWRRQAGLAPAIFVRGSRPIARVVLVREKGQKLFDRDNLYGALKPVMDWLVTAGWIFDDSEKAIDYQASQDRGDLPQVRVTIEQGEAT